MLRALVKRFFFVIFHNSSLGGQKKVFFVIYFNSSLGGLKRVFFRHIPQFVIGGSNKGFFSSYTYFKTSKKASCFTNFTHFLTEIFSSKLFLVLLWFIGYFVLKLTKFKTNLFMIKNTSPNCLNLWKFLTLNWMWKGYIFKKVSITTMYFLHVVYCYICLKSLFCHFQSCFWKLWYQWK